MRIVVRMLIVSFLAAVTSLQAITYIVPNDRDLVKRAEAIIIGTALSSHAELVANGSVVTIATFEVERALKGRLSEEVDIVEPGGRVGVVSTAIPGSPRFESGKRYLVFLIRNNRGDWATYGFALGVFEIVSDLHGRTIATRGKVEEGLFGFEEGTWAPHVEHLRGAPEFINFVATVAENDGAPARTDYFVDRSQLVFDTFLESRPRITALIPRALATRPDYLFAGNYRWQSTAVTFDYCCVSKGLQPGLDGPGAVAAGTANWRSAGAGIGYTLGTNNESATGGLPQLGRGSSDNISAVLFNDPFNDFAASGVPAGVVGIGGISKAGFQNYSLGDGTPGGYIPTLEGDVVIAKASTLAGVTQATFDLVVTHELGHTLGFRHSDGTSDPNSPQNGQSCNPSTSPCANPGIAVMASIVFSNLGGLRQWDLDAAQTTYGSGPVCTPPSISNQPADVTITSGQQTTLSVSASGTSLTYQWYVGNPPSTTTPAPNGTSFQLIVAPTATTTYWVRASGCSTSVNSRGAVVTVTCAPPTAPTPNASPSSVQSGQSSTLSVNPTGTGPFTYQWYVGNSGNTTAPVPGATGSFANVSPTTNTSYWVRVTGQCGSPSDSPAVTVTVTCSPIASGPVANPSTINAGGSSTLSITTNGSGPFTIQWYTGNVGDTSNPIQGANGTSIQVSPAASAIYWVHVTAPCGSQDGSVIVFVSGGGCTQASITTNPAFVTIPPGTSATLSVVVAGTPPITYQWYTGTSGNTTNPINNATGASITVTPTATVTSYWVHVSNSCNTVGVNSTTGVVTLSASCPSPAITTQPAGVIAGIGTAATLKVIATATGTTLHYQWYKGLKGDLSTKVGTDAASFTTPTITAGASYWVRVTAACSNTSFTDSNTATITAVPTRIHAVKH